MKKTKSTPRATPRRCAVSTGSPSVDSALRELHGATEDLMQIVEGFRGERWAANGKRLVDTPEWCRFYVARCAVNRAQENTSMTERRAHDSAQPNSA